MKRGTIFMVLALALIGCKKDQTQPGDNAPECHYAQTDSSFSTVDFSVASDFYIEEHDNTENANSRSFDLDCDGEDDIRLVAEQEDDYVYETYSSEGTVRIDILNNKTFIKSVTIQDSLFKKVTVDTTGIDIVSTTIYSQDSTEGFEFFSTFPNFYASPKWSESILNSADPEWNSANSIVRRVYTDETVWDYGDIGGYTYQEHTYRDFEYGLCSNNETVYIGTKIDSKQGTKMGYLVINPYATANTAIIRLESWGIQK